MSDDPLKSPKTAKSSTTAKKQPTPGKPVSGAGAKQPIPVYIPPRIDLEKGFHNNDNDKVGVIVEIPERSM